MEEHKHFESSLKVFKGRGAVTGKMINTEILFNPNAEELEKIALGTKGFLSAYGDLYIASTLDVGHEDLLEIIGSPMIHESLRKPAGNYLQPEVLVNADMHGVCVVRDSSNHIKVAASYEIAKPLEEEDALFFVFNYAEEVNSHLEFSL